MKRAMVRHDSAPRSSRAHLKVNAVQPYSIEIATERFLLWAACRAAQAGSARATRREFIPALRSCGVMEWLKEPANHLSTDSVYDVEFDKWVTKVQRHVRLHARKHVKYGVGAKLVSTYVKGTFLLGTFRGTILEKHVMPPLDSILLKGLGLSHKWQQLTRAQFKRLIVRLRELPGYEAKWELERDWDPGV